MRIQSEGPSGLKFEIQIIMQLLTCLLINLEKLTNHYTCHESMTDMSLYDYLFYQLFTLINSPKSSFGMVFTNYFHINLSAPVCSVYKGNKNNKKNCTKNIVSIYIIYYFK